MNTVSSSCTNALGTLSLYPRWQRYKTAAKYRPLAKALRLFVQLDETQSHWIPFDLYIIRWNSDIGII